MPAPTPVQTSAPQQSTEPAPLVPPTESGSVPPSAAVEIESLTEALVIPKSFSFRVPTDQQLDLLPPDIKGKSDSNSVEISGPDGISKNTPQMQSPGMLDQLGIWLAWLLIGVGVIGVLIGCLRLLQGLRTKSLVRKIA